MTTETETYRCYSIEITPDEIPLNPREDFDNLGTFWTSERNYISPDKKPLGGILDNLAPMLDLRPGASERTIMRHLDQQTIWLPVFKYEHGGVIYKAAKANPFHCKWDSGQVGLIFVTRKQVREEWGAKRINTRLKRHVQGVLRGEVETYSSWANGSVYCASVYDPAGNLLEDVGGGSFFGCDHEESGLMSECCAAIDLDTTRRAKARNAKLKKLIINGVSLAYRPGILAGAEVRT